MHASHGARVFFLSSSKNVTVYRYHRASGVFIFLLHDMETGKISTFYAPLLPILDFCMSRCCLPTSAVFCDITKSLHVAIESLNSSGNAELMILELRKLIVKYNAVSEEGRLSNARYKVRHSHGQATRHRNTSSCLKMTRETRR